MSKLIYYAACLFVVFNCASAELELVNGTIKITIGTTSRCSDTRNFIIDQLAETYQEYGRFLDVEFVPWGRTVLNENGSMTCQFGPTDCFANRIQRCALDLLNGNQDAQVFYMICEFTSPYPSISGSYLCGQAVGLNLIDLDYCVATTGVALDLAAREAAAEPMSIINFVPSIHFNDVIDIDLHNQARQRLRSIVCFALAADPNTGVSNCQV